MVDNKFVTQHNEVNSLKEEWLKRKEANLISFKQTLVYTIVIFLVYTKNKKRSEGNVEF